MKHVVFALCGLMLLFTRNVELYGQTGYRQEGLASYYADRFQGRTTASGERYDLNGLTCAHMTLPYGTSVRVVNLSNSQSVVVRVNDRGPFVPNRIIDLSRRAAEAIGMITAGVTKVRIETVPASELERQRVPMARGEGEQVGASVSTPSGARKEPDKPSTGKVPEGGKESASATGSQTTGATGTRAAGLKGKLPDGRDFFLRVVDGQSGQFGVQIASYREVSNLLKAVGDWEYSLRSRLVILSPQGVEGGIHKVVVGPFPTRAEAVREQEGLGARFPGCFIVGL